MAKGILKGEKIRLRPLKQEDVPLVVKWNLHPEVLKWTANSISLDMKMKKAALANIENTAKRMRKNRKMFIIEIKDSRHWKPIGDCELSDIDKRNQNAIFSICIDPNYWRNGYGAEATKLLLDYAFKKMHLHRIESRVREYNKPSIAFHRKFGFVEEGCRKEAKFQNGRFWDRIIFRLLESEWENISKSQ